LLNNPTLNESLIIRKTGGATLDTFTIYLDNSSLLAFSNFKTSSGIGTGQVKYFVSEPTNNLYEGLFAEGQTILDIGGIANAYTEPHGKPWETAAQGTVTAPPGWLSKDFSDSGNFGSTSNYLNPARNYTTESPVGNINYTLIFKRSTPTPDSSLQINGQLIASAPINTSPLGNGEQIEFKFEDIYLLPTMDGVGAHGSGVLNQPYEPVNSAYANPLTDFNNLLRLVDLYDPTAFDTNTRTWKELLTGPLGTNDYLGRWTATDGPPGPFDIEPQAIF
jgi:hypothetical protein